MFNISVLQLLRLWQLVHTSGKHNSSFASIKPSCHCGAICRSVKFYRCHFSQNAIQYLCSKDCGLIGKLEAITMTQCLVGKAQWYGRWNAQTPLLFDECRPPVTKIASNLEAPLGKSLPHLHAPKGKQFHPH